MSRTNRFSSQSNLCNDENINKDDYGFLLLRTNYKVGIAF